MMNKTLVVRFICLVEMFRNDMSSNFKIIILVDHALVQHIDKLLCQPLYINFSLVFSPLYVCCITFYMLVMLLHFSKRDEIEWLYLRFFIKLLMSCTLLVISKINVVDVTCSNFIDI